MQTEIAIEIEDAAGLTRRRNGNIRAQFPVTGIAMGRRGVQPIQAAAQDDRQASTARNIATGGVP